MAPSLAFLLDVDNTLIDNDAVTADLKAHLEDEFGKERAHAYWNCFEKLREELGYADYLGALQRYRIHYPRDPHILQVSKFIVDYPFSSRVFPHAFDVITHLKQWGQVVIVSDGDVVFQPLKIERSGLSQAVDGHVLIYIHKEKDIEDVEERYPATHYVMIDDKLHVLAAMKQRWKTRVTTIFVRQGHYSHDPHLVRANPSADGTIERIGDLLKHDCRQLVERLADRRAK